MTFTVLIPARLKSTRLPDKPLADLHGAPMVVRVAQRAAQSAAARVVVAADDARIVDACRAHGVRRAAHTHRPRQRQRPPGRGLRTAAARRRGHRRQRARRRAADRHRDDRRLRGAAEATQRLRDGHRGARDRRCRGVCQPQRGEGRARCRRARVVLLARADPALARPQRPPPRCPPSRARCATSACTPTARASCAAFPRCRRRRSRRVEALEQLRVLWQGERIAVHVSSERPGPGVDTPADLERVRALWPRPAEAAGVCSRRDNA